MNLSIAGNTYSTVIPTTSSSTRTVTFEITEQPLNSNTNIEISFTGDTRATIRALKIYYK